jgi:hypothetical protein
VTRTRVGGQFPTRVVPLFHRGRAERAHSAADHQVEAVLVRDELPRESGGESEVLVFEIGLPSI